MKNNNDIPFSRRRFIAGASVALATTGIHGLLMPKKAWAQSIQRGGALTLSVPGPVSDLDPHKVVSHESYPATFHIFSALTRIGSDFNAEPELAKSWSTNDGGETWIFKLFENAKFHNGRAVTAEDMQSPKYVRGQSCPRCYDDLSDAQRHSFAERQRQVELAKQRGTKHIGADFSKDRGESRGSI